MTIESDLPTYKLGTVSALQGEILNGGTAIDGHFYIKVWQNVQIQGDVHKRGIVLKVQEGVLCDTPPRGEFIHRLVEERS